MLTKQPPGPHERAHRVRVAWDAGCPAAEWRTIEARFGLTERECYGMTNASSITISNANGIPEAIGRPLPWFSVALVDAKGHAGRLADSVSCHGENVSACEVEHIAVALSVVESCAMIDVPAEIGELDIKLFVQRRPGAMLTTPELSRWLAERLSPHQNRRYIAFAATTAGTLSCRRCSPRSNS